jgi:hypothetical protein
MADFKSKKHTVIKWFCGALLIVSLIVGACSWYLGVKLKPVISEQLKEIVQNATDSLYTVEFSGLSTNFVFGYASLTDVRLIPDTNVLKKLVGQKLAPNNIYEVELKKLAIKNFHSIRFYKERRLNINQLIFDKPHIVMTNRQYRFNENKPARPNKSPYDYISRFLKELRVETISFKDIRFKYINKNKAVAEVDSVDKLNITLKDWLIDAKSASDTTRFYLLKDVIINLKDYTFATPDSMYHINVNQMDFAASTGKLNIKRFDFTPRYDEMAFGIKAGYARDRFHIDMNDISLEGIDLLLYVRKQELMAREMNISNGFISVFNNNELKRRGTIKSGKYPHQLLQKLTDQLTVKELNLQNIDVSYAEYDRVSKQKGKITFQNTSGKISNLTNSEKMKAMNPYMHARLSTLMMGKGKLDVVFRFDLNAPDGAFSYTGGLGVMDGKVLNQITKPLGMVQVNRGEVKSLLFDIQANEHDAHGKVDFKYNDLSIALLKKVEGRERLVKQGWKSILANAMVINSSNPDAEGKYISAPVYYERNSRMTFFSFVWRTLFSGIRHSVGVTKEKQKLITQKIAEFERIRENRQERKENRDERRQRGGTNHNKR